MENERIIKLANITIICIIMASIIISTVVAIDMSTSKVISEKEVPCVDNNKTEICLEEIKCSKLGLWERHTCSYYEKLREVNK